MVPESRLLPVRGHCWHRLGLPFFLNKFTGWDSTHTFGGKHSEGAYVGSLTTGGLTTILQAIKHVDPTSFISICLFRMCLSSPLQEVTY
jgi:hypothetical protein